MNGIFFVLKTGCQWRALDVTSICPGATAHHRFEKWRRAGVFKKFWKKGLQKYDVAKGIDWKWQSIDASLVKAPVAGSKKTGKNSTDRGKRGAKRSILVDGRGVPISIVIAGANVFDSKLLATTFNSIIIRRPDPKHVRQHLLADKAYGDDESRKTAIAYGYQQHTPQKKNAKFKILRQQGRRKARRWIVEQTFGCLNRNREVGTRWQKIPENYEAILHLAAGILCFKRSKRKS